LGYIHDMYENMNSKRQKTTQKKNRNRREVPDVLELQEFLLW